MPRKIPVAIALLVTPLMVWAADHKVGPANAPSAQQTVAVNFRIGIIGCDTSHVGAFTALFNDPANTGDYVGMRVVAAYPGGSNDVPDSYNRVARFTEEERKAGVEIVDSIPKLLEKVDGVLLESVDGRPHLEQVRPVLAAGKPVFIDKPLAGSLADGIAIEELGRKFNTPWFSSSSTRFGPAVTAMRGDAKVGAVIGAFAWSPAKLEKSHPDLFWYGIHGVELLFTAMGPGCESVTRTHADNADIVTGIWKDGRVGTYRGNRPGANSYGFVAYGAKSTFLDTKDEGYKVLTDQIAHFFRTRQVPFPNVETIEILAFMEAADESKRQNGAPVKLQTVMAKAKEQAKAKLIDK